MRLIPAMSDQHGLRLKVVGRYARQVGPLTLVIALAPLVSGCPASPRWGLCEKTVIQVEDVAVLDDRTPFTLTARLLTEDGMPVEGAWVDFFTIRQDSTGEPAIGSGTSAGGARVDAAGVATVEFADGVLVWPRRDGVRVVRYGAQFHPLRDYDGVWYCNSRATAAVTVEGAEPIGSAGGTTDVESDAR